MWYSPGWEVTIRYILHFYNNSFAIDDSSNLSYLVVSNRISFSRRGYCNIINNIYISIYISVFSLFITLHLHTSTL